MIPDPTPVTNPTAGIVCGLILLAILAFALFATARNRADLRDERKQENPRPASSLLQWPKGKRYTAFRHHEMYFFGDVMTCKPATYKRLVRLFRLGVKVRGDWGGKC